MKTRKPFFARFLENQELDSVGGSKGPGHPVTMKYPSDDDEGIIMRPMQTMKYPSDGDDGMTS